MSQCKKFAPNIFHKTKCSNCFRQKEEHSAEALECNRASRSIARSGYLFVAPDWDFSVPLNRTKRWQRRWFVLYDDGELNYSVDEHPDTVPQGSVDMSKVLEVTGAEQITGHPHSLALTGPDRVTFVKAASREDARWWAELLAVFPRRHKRNATFPGGRASPSLPQLGRSASPQPPRPRHLSYIGPSTRTTFATTFREEKHVENKSLVAPEISAGWTMEKAPPKTDYLVTSGSPPTHDKIRPEDTVASSRDWRKARLRDIASALTDHSSDTTVALPAEGVLNLKKGWLWYKEKNTDNEWVRRWWVLCEQTLNSYIDQDDQSIPEITIELPTINSVTEVSTDVRYGFQINWSGPTYILSAVTSNIRCNWLQMLKKAISTVDSPSAPATPRSCLFSSDEEYRTASEGGRRDSEDWGEIPSSPPLPKNTFSKVKDRSRLKTKLPRNQSRQSTLDSVSTDEIDACRPPDEMEIKNSVNKQTLEIDALKQQLSCALTEMQNLETQLSRCKKLQSESLVREEHAKELIGKLEKTEANLNKKIEHMEEKTKHDEKVLRSQLTEAKLFVKKTQDTFILLTEEVQAKQAVVSNLQEELHCLKEKYNETRQENNRLYKKIQEIENKPYRRKRLDSLTELIDINQDINFESLGHAELIEQCLDLRNRLETAVIEIKAMKKELRESHIKYDQLELETVGLRKNVHMIEQESLAQSTLMADRVQDLTVKLATAEKQARNLKSKLQDSREKRRSLSLKGRENFSINKEIEDKITELEAKIITLEKNKSRRKQRRDRSSDRISPIDDKSQRRFRRKSLDSATSSEPIKLFMRLNNLEGKIMNAANSNESLNTSSTSYSDTKTDEIGNTNLYAECVILAAVEKLNNCKYACNLLRTNTNNIYVDELNILENNLSELSCILKSNVRENEINTIYSSANRIVRQLENILKEKLRNLYDKKKTLMKSCQLNDEAKLEILAEKFAYEDVIINRIHQALSVSAFNNNCTRHFLKESLETMNLLCNLNEKLCDKRKKEIPLFKTSVDYLTKILTKRLLTAAHNYSVSMPVSNKCAPALSYLEEKQLEVSNLMGTYKLNKLPQLADALAFETITTATDSNCNVQSLGDDMIDEIRAVARNVVNCELIESEINHIMMRTAQLYEEKSSLDQNYCFTFFAYERATLELWSDSVETQLQLEMDKNIEELTKMFNYSLSKLQKQDWRKQLESQWSSINVKALLLEFADVISHKSLIDARIKVLKSEYKIADKDIDDYNDDSLLVYLQNEKYLNYLEETDILHVSKTLEAEFKCMFNKYRRECENSLMKADLLEVKNTLRDLSMQILDIVNCCTGKVIKDLMPISSLQDICNQCEHLKKLLIDIKDTIVYMKNTSRVEAGEEKLPLYLGTEYLNQVENLRSAYRRSLGDCDSRKQQTDLERLQVLCEQVLVAMEQWHRKTLQELREQHTRELQALHQDKEQALAEETQATLAALDAMRKAHEAEVQREVARFKQDFARQQQDELLDLTERLSVKCLEAAALEEQLGSATRQLAHAQQHILQLERNPQLSLQN